MGDTLSPTNEFLLREYETAVKLTYHADEVRNKLTSFFLTGSGAAVAAVAFLLKERTDARILGQPEAIVAIFLFLIALVGLMIVGVLAKLRRVQLEHYRIINNIRSYYLGTDYSLWNVVELSKNTLPLPSRHTGTYFWLSTILLLNSFLISLSVYLLIVKVCFLVDSSLGYLIALGVLLICLVIQDNVYFTEVAPPPQPNYSKDNFDFTEK